MDSTMTLNPLHSKQNLCGLCKYIAALLVVNGHLFLFGNSDSSLTPYMNLGPCCVALFFFFSGYGLIFSYKTKGNTYLKGFFHKRFFKILWPLVTAYAICLPIYALLKGPIDITTLLTTLYWGGPYLKFSWFVSEILIVYLLFFVVMKLPPGCSDNNKLIIVSLGIIMLMAILFITHQPNWYIISLPGFILGMWYCNYENQVIGLSTTQVYFIAITLGLAWVLTWQWNHIFASYLPEYKYAFIASIVSPAAFTLLITSILACAPNTPPPHTARNQLIL